MTTSLEDRYARLLRAYPAAYREEHGPAMLDCLLEGAAPDQTLPSAREAAALVIGGLRARALTRSGPTSRAVWASGLRVGAFLALGVQAGLAVPRWHLSPPQFAFMGAHGPATLAWLGRRDPLSLPLDSARVPLVLLVWVAALVAATARARVRTVAVWGTAALALVATVDRPITYGLSFFGDWTAIFLPAAAGLLLPAVILLALRRGLGDHARWTFVLALVGPLGVGVLVDAVAPFRLSEAIASPSAALLIVAAAVALADPRLAIASTVALLGVMLASLGDAARTMAYNPGSRVHFVSGHGDAMRFVYGRGSVLHSTARLYATQIHLGQLVATTIPFLLMLGISVAGSRRWTRATNVLRS